MRHLILITLLLTASALCSAQTDTSFRDDFSTYAAGTDGSPTWDSDGVAWTVAGGKFLTQSKGRSTALCATAARGRGQTIETTLTVKEATNTGWKVTGLMIQDDDRNYWHLALVESPDEAGKKHFCELQESYDGQWLATSGEETRLTNLHNGTFEWEFDHPYRLRLELAAETIIGTVSELDGAERARIGFKFDNKAVKEGRAALTTSSFRSEFDDFAVEVKAAAPERPVVAQTFAPCDTKGHAAVRGRATGFFRVEQQAGRWWLITPRGEGFYALGTDHASYNAHWCEKLGYAPYHRNCVEKYNGDEEAWGKSTGDRLKSWNFNAVGCGWSRTMKNQSLPRDEFISFGSSFASMDDIAPQVNWTGFPNVFSPRWESYCDKRARSICAPLASDPWIIGYFLDNELEWFGKNGKQWGLFDECTKKPAGHSAKTAMVDFLQKRYRTVADLNKAWGTKFESWEALTQNQDVIETVSEKATADRMAFVRLIAERYFSVTNAAMKRHDPNHMNIGTRFAGWAPDGVMEIYGKHCEVVSVNFYGRVDLQKGISTDMPQRFAEYAAQCKRPMMITEWSFPAYDSGLPCEHGAGQRVATQAEKARCYEIYQTALMQFPFMVGSNYFMWVDEPALGISSTFPEDSNYGLVDVNDDPWRELTETATRVNARVYEIHSGRTPEITVALAKDGQAVTVKNTGGSAASFDLELWVDGQKQVLKQRVPAGGSVRHAVNLGTKPGGHMVAVVADPEHRLSETDRSDNTATRQAYRGKCSWAAAPAGAAQRVPVVISNDTGTPQRGVVFSQMLPGLTKWTDGARVVLAETGEEIPAQLDGMGETAELSFLPGDLPPYSCRTALVYPGTASGKPALADVKLTEGGFEVNTGALTLKHAADRPELLSEVRAGDLPLGRFVALMHQSLAQDLWVAADQPVQVQAYNGAVRFAADVTVACARGGSDSKSTADQTTGEYEAQKTAPQPYRACYRIAAYPGKPWFASRLLWVENSGKEPWRLADYFHYAISEIGGSPADDQVARQVPPGVTAWENAKLGAYYGYLGGPGSDFSALFWKDPAPATGQHPDVRRPVEKTLAPGQRYAEPQPAAVFFGLRGGAADLRALAAQTQAALWPQWRAFPVEKR